MALEKKYRCMNVGNCKNANEKKVFAIAEGEEAKCPVCGSNMLVEVKSSNKLVIIVVAAVVIVGAVLGILFALNNQKTSTQPEPNTPTEEVVTENTTPETEEVVDEPSGEQVDSALIDVLVNGPKDTSDAENAEAVQSSNSDAKADNAKEEFTKEATTAKDQANTTTTPVQPKTYNLGWGIYDGPMQGGKPHGNNGVINVKSTHNIELNNMTKDVVTVKKGDKIISVMARNGRIISGTIKFADGRQTTFNSGAI